jgi:hypothetical protein
MEIKNKKLRAIPSPTEPRTIISFMTAGVIINGESASSPDYTCGACDAVLVSRCLLKQFMRHEHFTGALPFESLGASITPLDYPAGLYPIRQTINLRTTTMVSYGGDLVIQCAVCKTFNEMPSTSLLYDREN